MQLKSRTWFSCGGRDGLKSINATNEENFLMLQKQYLVKLTLPFAFSSDWINVIKNLS